MSLRVNTNVAAMNAYRNLTVTEGNLGKSLEKLSSGFRINRASDDAAGLVNSENLRSQVGGLKVASRNAQDGVSVAQTAEGALNETTSILQRMRDLAVQKSSTGGNSSAANDAMDQEFSALNDEISRIGSSTDFNGNKLLNGSYTAAKGTFQVGANAGTTDQVSLDLSATKLTTNLSSVGTQISGGTAGLGDSLVSFVAAVSGGVAAHYVMASNAISAVDTAITAVSTARGGLGAFQNRLEHTIANLGVATENLSASESRIRDTDMAQEMTSFSKNQILSQAGTAMLAQANQSSQGVLSLLRG